MCKDLASISLRRKKLILAACLFGATILMFAAIFGTHPWLSAFAQSDTIQPRISNFLIRDELGRPLLDKDGGLLAITVSVADSFSSDTGITRVELHNRETILEIVAEPSLVRSKTYSFFLDTTAFPNGTSLQIFVKAFDGAGNQSVSQTISVIVKNNYNVIPPRCSIVGGGLSCSYSVAGAVSAGKDGTDGFRLESLNRVDAARGEVLRWDAAENRWIGGADDTTRINATTLSSAPAVPLRIVWSPPRRDLSATVNVSILASSVAGYPRCRIAPVLWIGSSRTPRAVWRSVAVSAGSGGTSANIPYSLDRDSDLFIAVAPTQDAECNALKYRFNIQYLTGNKPPVLTKISGPPPVLSFGYPNPQVRFDFIVHDEAPSKITYRCSINGLSSAPGCHDIIGGYYEILRAGNYRITLVAVDAGGIESSPLNWEFNVGPSCGNSIVDHFYYEQCDLGPQNGKPGAQCNSSCQLIPVPDPASNTQIGCTYFSDIPGTSDSDPFAGPSERKPNEALADFSGGKSYAWRYDELNDTPVGTQHFGYKCEGLFTASDSGRYMFVAGTGGDLLNVYVDDQKIPFVSRSMSAGVMDTELSAGAHRVRLEFQHYQKTSGQGSLAPHPAWFSLAWAPVPKDQWLGITYDRTTNRFQSTNVFNEPLADGKGLEKQLNITVSNIGALFAGNFNFPEAGTYTFTRNNRSSVVSIFAGAKKNVILGLTSGDSADWNVTQAGRYTLTVPFSGAGNALLSLRWEKKTAPEVPPPVQDGNTDQGGTTDNSIGTIPAGSIPAGLNTYLRQNAKVGGYIGSGARIIGKSAIPEGDNPDCAGCLLITAMDSGSDVRDPNQIASSQQVSVDNGPWQTISPNGLLLRNLSEGIHEVLSTRPEGYKTAYSIFIGGRNHSPAACQTGERAQVYVSADSFASLQWHYLNRVWARVINVGSESFIDSCNPGISAGGGASAQASAQKGGGAGNFSLLSAYARLNIPVGEDIPSIALSDRLASIPIKQINLRREYVDPRDNTKNLWGSPWPAYALPDGYAIGSPPWDQPTNVQWNIPGCVGGKDASGRSFCYRFAGEETKTMEDVFRAAISGWNDELTREGGVSLGGVDVVSSGELGRRALSVDTGAVYITGVGGRKVVVNPPQGIKDSLSLTASPAVVRSDLFLSTAESVNLLGKSLPAQALQSYIGNLAPEMNSHAIIFDLNDWSLLGKTGFHEPPNLVAIRDGSKGSHLPADPVFLYDISKRIWKKFSCGDEKQGCPNILDILAILPELGGYVSTARSASYAFNYPFGVLPEMLGLKLPDLPFKCGFGITGSALSGTYSAGAWCGDTLPSFVTKFFGELYPRNPRNWGGGGAGGVAPQLTTSPVARNTKNGGAIKYYANSQSVSGVAVERKGTRQEIAQTNASGGYVFPQTLAAGDTLTPRKSGREESAISALDAVWVLQSTLGIRALTPQQKLAADVSGNGEISALDAALILRYTAGIIDKFPAAETCGSDWLFIPKAASGVQTIQPELRQGTCRNGSISITQPASGASYDFNAVLIGDITGNWKATQ